MGRLLCFYIASCDQSKNKWLIHPMLTQIITIDPLFASSYQTLIQVSPLQQEIKNNRLFPNGCQDCIKYMIDLKTHVNAIYVERVNLQNTIKNGSIFMIGLDQYNKDQKELYNCIMKMLNKDDDFETYKDFVIILRDKLYEELVNITFAM